MHTLTQKQKPAQKATSADSTIVHHRAAFAGIQKKLTINTPGDLYEQEAESVADQVMRMPTSAETAFSPIGIQRSEGKATSEGTVADAGASSVVRDVLASPGQPLPEALRAFMEPRFDHDFSQVRVHTDARAAETARALHAAAYTTGSNIVFGRGRCKPYTNAGKHLFAHELTHVLQQSAPGTRTVAPHPGSGRLIQRTPEDEAAAGEVAVAPLVLTNPRFVGNWILDRILNGRIPTLSSRHNGRRGAVYLVQQALEALGFELPSHLTDGSYGDETEEAIRQFRARYGPSSGNQLDGATLVVLDRLAPAPGVRHEHTVDYDRLLADRRLEVTVALGATDTTVIQQTSPGIYKRTERPTEDLEAERFREWMVSKGFSLELLGLSSNEHWKATRTITWTSADGTRQSRKVDIWINLIVPAAGAAREFQEGLSSSEITIYSGHARYGSGLDFDAKANPAENFRIGIDRAMSDAGRRTRVDVARRHGVAVDEEHDLLNMVNSGNFDPDRYRVLFFNACTSLAYLDEIREHIGGTENVDVVATRRPSMFTTVEARVAVAEVQRFLEGVFATESVESVVAGLNEVQRLMHTGRRLPHGRIFSSSGLGDNPRAP